MPVRNDSTEERNDSALPYEILAGKRQLLYDVREEAHESGEELLTRLLVLGRSVAKMPKQKPIEDKRKKTPRYKPDYKREER